MAQLHRFVKLNDRFDTQVFTFILPSTLIQQTSPDVLSREFVYGNQKWRVAMMRNDKHLSAYLTHNNSCDGLTVVMDFSFTMVNSEHFTRNDTYSERNCKFTVAKSMHGRRTFIGLSDLQNRGFLHFSRHFVVELEVRNTRNVFEQVLQLPREGKEADSVHYTYPKYETLYFSWGLFDWNLGVYPFGDCSETDSFSLVYLTRQTSFDHLCRVRYKIILGSGDRKVESQTIEQIIDMSGTGTPYESGYSIYQFADSKGKLPIKIELLHVTAISEVEIQPFTRGKNKAHLYDRDKQAWMLEADVSLEHLRTRIYYADVYNVPRKFMRFVSWSMSIVPTKGHTKRKTAATGSPFSNYYIQTDTDEGYDMITEIPVEELKESGSAFMDEEHKTLTLHVEWIDSHLLYHTKYHRLDEVNSKQKHQMWREIMALQAENYALEKQVFSYQQSIDKMGSKTNLHELTGSQAALHDLPAPGATARGHDIDGQIIDPALILDHQQRGSVGSSGTIATTQQVIASEHDSLATGVVQPRESSRSRDVTRDVMRERDLARDLDGKSDKSDRSRGSRDRSGSSHKRRHRRSDRTEQKRDCLDQMDYKAEHQGSTGTKSSTVSSSISSSKATKDRYDQYGRYDDPKDSKPSDYDKYDDTRSSGKYTDTAHRNGRRYSDGVSYDSKYDDSPSSKYDAVSRDSFKGSTSSRRGSSASKYDSRYDNYDDYDRYEEYDYRYDNNYSDKYSDTYDQTYDRSSLDRESYDLSPYERSSYSRNSYDHY